jgi:hypothetical protein
VRRLTGDYPAAARDLADALIIYRGIGDRLGEGHALSVLGAVCRAAGDYPAAARDLAEALTVFSDLGARSYLAEVLNEFGTLYRVRGDLQGPGPITGRPWTWPARSGWPGTRRTR